MFLTGCLHDTSKYDSHFVSPNPNTNGNLFNLKIEFYVKTDREQMSCTLYFIPIGTYNTQQCKH